MKSPCIDALAPILTAKALLSREGSAFLDALLIRVSTVVTLRTEHPWSDACKTTIYRLQEYQKSRHGVEVR